MSIKHLYQGTVGTSSGTKLYTAPSGYLTLVKTIDICNYTTGSLTIKIHFVTSGGSVADSNMFIPDITIGAKSMYQWTGEQLMESESFIQGIASGTGINVRIYGDEARRV